MAQPNSINQDYIVLDIKPEVPEIEPTEKKEEPVENNYFHKFLCMFNPNTITNKELFGSDDQVHPLCVCISKVFVILLRLINVCVILLCITFIFYIIYLSITGKKMK